MTTRPSTEYSRANLLKVETQQVQETTVSQYLGSPSRMSSIQDCASATGTKQLYYLAVKWACQTCSSPAQVGTLPTQISKSIGVSEMQPL